MCTKQNGHGKFFPEHKYHNSYLTFDSVYRMLHNLGMTKNVTLVFKSQLIIYLG